MSTSRSAFWRRSVIALAAIGLVASAAALIPGAGTPPRIDSALLHPVTRGDLQVTVTEQGTLESARNTEIKCQVRGDNTIIWVVESGTQVEAGDELVRLDTLFIEEQISERTKFFHLATSAAARSQADVARATLAVDEYLQGRFVSDLATLNKDLAIAKSRLSTARNMLAYSNMMAESDYANELEVEERAFRVAQAELDVQLTETRIDVLKRFTKEEQLATLQGELNASKAEYEADKERALADRLRLERAQLEFEHCVIRAPRSGIVIYPTGKQWEDAPDIEEGATVHKDQVLLLMPDLQRMQVKVGIHESLIDRVHSGLPAMVTLPGKTLEGRVSTVAEFAEPAGWWTGNVVKYDTMIEMPPGESLKPGMSVGVEVILAQYDEVLTIPVAAVMEADAGHACWVETAAGPQRRQLQLGDGSDLFLVVNDGLRAGDRVVLDPLANLAAAQFEAAATLEKTKAGEGENQHGD